MNYSYGVKDQSRLKSRKYEKEIAEEPIVSKIGYKMISIKQAETKCTDPSKAVKTNVGTFSDLDFRGFDSTSKPK